MNLKGNKTAIIVAALVLLLNVSSSVGRDPPRTNPRDPPRPNAREPPARNSFTAMRYDMVVGKACRADSRGRARGVYDSYDGVSLEWCAKRCEEQGTRCEGFEYSWDKRDCEIHTEYGGYFENDTNEGTMCAWKVSTM
mmetsp:Transcript_31318/g.69374  ORF Transcript_31318/g.69374 Transcript_31318/m.69374 type:complete len:138 (+) Transcript_31318:299-712(+)